MNLFVGKKLRAKPEHRDWPDDLDVISKIERHAERPPFTGRPWLVNFDGNQTCWMSAEQIAEWFDELSEAG